MGIVPYQSKGQYSFQKVFGGKGDDNSCCVLELSNGNFLFAGVSSSFPYECYLACFTKEGNLVWSKNYGYHGKGAEDRINTIIEASDGNIYIGGDGFVWNAEGNPILTKYTKEGSFIYDSAYRLPLNGLTNSRFNFFIDEADTKSLVSIGDGSDNIHYCPVFQKTRYTGERLYYKYLTELNGMGAIGFYNSIGKSGYTMLCDSVGYKKYLVSLDTAGNVIDKKYLFTSTDRCRFVYNDDGSTVFLNWDEMLMDTNPGGKILKFNYIGDSLFSNDIKLGVYSSFIFRKSIDRYILFGRFVSELDTNFNVISIIPNYEKGVKIGLDRGTVSLAKDGSIFGVADYSGGIRTNDNLYDFYFFKTYPWGILNPDVGFMRTGIEEESTNKSAIDVFPNPANIEISISTPTKNTTYIFTNMYGEFVRKGKSQNINTSSLANGIYFITLYDEEQNILGTEKVVINHE